jgi:heme exporter protein A
MPAALEVEHVSKRFGSTLALDDLAWTVDRGEAVALLGPNGAGKTTLLRLCATLLRPTQGTVRVLGLDPASQGTAVRRRIAVLGHESWLYSDLSTRENLRFYARLFGVADAPARVDALIERVGLGGWSHRPVGVLSRGLLQRAALARVLLHDPEVLLLDEPFTGLDLGARDWLCEVLRDAHHRGVTLVMSTHDVDHGLALCSAALILLRGRIGWQGRVTPDNAAEVGARYRAVTHGADDRPAAAALSPGP